MKKRTGVLLLQMGGPRSLDEVKPYIRNLFRDPYLVRLPAPLSWFRKPLSTWVAYRRAPKVRAQYETIGGFSPNNAITMKQASALQELLKEYGDYRCYAGMSYTSPLVKDALHRSQQEGCNSWIALPMFPQFSIASTGALLKELERSCRALGIQAEDMRTIFRWSQRNDYLDALSANTLAALDAANIAGDSPAHLLVSAHGLPLSYIHAGDTYVQEVEESVAGLQARLPLNQNITLSYQSRATPTKWVEPSTSHVLHKLGAQGVKNVVVLPISFVNDHIETLFEIDQLLAEDARRAGILHYRRVPVFNEDPSFIEILKALVLDEVKIKTHEETAMEKKN